MGRSWARDRAPLAGRRRAARDRRRRRRGQEIHSCPDFAGGVAATAGACGVTSSSTDASASASSAASGFVRIAGLGRDRRRHRRGRLRRGGLDARGAAAPEAAPEDLVHRRVVVAALHRLHLEAPVVLLVQLAVEERHDRPHGVSAAEMRDVAALDPVRSEGKRRRSRSSSRRDSMSSELRCFSRNECAAFSVAIARRSTFGPRCGTRSSTFLPRRSPSHSATPSAPSGRSGTRISSGISAASRSWPA